jgi:hypothetical protein
MGMPVYYAVCLTMYLDLAAAFFVEENTEIHDDCKFVAYISAKPFRKL